MGSRGAEKIMTSDDAGGVGTGPMAIGTAFPAEVQIEINNRTTLQVLDSVLESVIRTEVSHPAPPDAWAALALDIGVVARRIGHAAEGVREIP